MDKILNFYYYGCRRESGIELITLGEDRGCVQGEDGSRGRKGAG